MSKALNFPLWNEELWKKGLLKELGNVGEENLQWNPLGLGLVPIYHKPKEAISLKTFPKEVAIGAIANPGQLLSCMPALEGGANAIFLSQAQNLALSLNGVLGNIITIFANDSHQLNELMRWYQSQGWSLSDCQMAIHRQEVQVSTDLLDLIRSGACIQDNCVEIKFSDTTLALASIQSALSSAEKIWLEKISLGYTPLEAAESICFMYHHHPSFWVDIACIKSVRAAWEAKLEEWSVDDARVFIYSKVIDSSTAEMEYDRLLPLTTMSMSALIGGSQVVAIQPIQHEQAAASARY
jgi:hypothetical protein